MYIHLQDGIDDAIPTRQGKNNVMNLGIRPPVVSRVATRLDIASPHSYEGFLARFENAVPMWTPVRLLEMLERKASWSEVVEDIAASAPHDFLLYWKLDLSPLMGLAGNTKRATEYLMGNHVIAETMYRHDPAVALYLPLRCAVYEARDGARFTIDQPSTALSDFGSEEIAAVGIDLDRKLARLLAALDVEVPWALAEERIAGRAVTSSRLRC
jgi:hypothetical protein